MCKECWEEYGSPKIKNEKIIKASIKIKEIFNISPIGGGLHLIIDQWNLEDEHLNNNWELTEKEEECLKLLKEMKLEERASCLAIVCEFI